MSKSNQEIWDDTRDGGSVGAYEYWQSIERFAEAIREDQREVCATEYYHHVYNTSKSSIGQIILNAGKEPMLKPGMLAVPRKDEKSPFAIGMICPYTDREYRPLTKAEIQAYMDKAPDHT